MTETPTKPRYTAYCVEVQYKPNDHWTRILETASLRQANECYDRRREPKKRLFKLEHTSMKEG